MQSCRQVFEQGFLGRRRGVGPLRSSSVCLQSIMFSLVVCAVQTVLCVPGWRRVKSWTAAGEKNTTLSPLL